MRDSVGIFVLLILIIFAGCNSTEKAKQEALVNYNDSIIAQQGKIVDHLMELNRHINDLEYSRLNEAYTNLLLQTDQSAQKIRQIGPYEGDSLFYQAAVDLFNHYETTFNTEYDTIIDILSLGEANITQEHLYFLDSVSTEIEKRETRAFESFQETHQKFAEKYGLDIAYEGVRDE